MMIYLPCFFSSIGEKQIKLLEDDCQQNRIEEKMLKFKIDHIKKMMDNECEKVYSLAQQRDEISAVSFSI